MFIVVPYVLFSEIYFFGQKRYFVTVEKQTVGVLALKDRTSTLYISNLAVSPFYRRIGVATYMLGFTTELAKKLGKSTLELSVNKANTPALRLYAKQGFRKEGERYSSYVLRKDVKGAS
jgi:ribosomal-protein-alanine N-acetyltransferase